MKIDLRADASALAPQLIALRRDLHRHPEIGLTLPRTQAKVLEALAGLPLEISTGDRLSSVVAVLRGDRSGPAVLLRADMDALPLTESSGEEFTSVIPGAMHACGHDLHTAGLVGAARLLSSRKDELAGSVVFMFQPGEEGDGGAKIMIEEGVLDAAGDRVIAAYGVHVLASVLPAGVIAVRPGPMLAGSDTAVVTVEGAGGHGSMPHLAADPVPVACEIVLALQSMVTRTFDVFDPVVVTVGQISAGTVSNIIPAHATLSVTLRCFSEPAHQALRERFTRVCEGITAAHGLTAKIDYSAGYPVTVNAPEEAQRVLRVATELLGAERSMLAPQPLSGSEDFSYVLEQVPGAYFGLGAAPSDVSLRDAAYNHSNEARFDDRTITDAAALLAALAQDRLYSV